MAGKQVRKLSGLKEDGTPNAYWRKFKERLSSYQDIPVKDWKEEQALAHILKRYKDYMGVEFSLSYGGPPTKCKEIYCTRRMILALGTEDGPTIKQYIDWLFNSVVIPGKVNISSPAFFFTDNLICKFKQEFRKVAKITRATELPEDIRQIAESLSVSVGTYGDLAMIKLIQEDDPENDLAEVYSAFFTKLVEEGFDEDILSNLDGK
jgi:hypothetical protein